MKQYYDYIITGAGCAGLSLLLRMLRQPGLRSKSILLVDKHFKNTNDRTWCFWETQPGFFEEIVYKRWRTLRFFSEEAERGLDIAPYEYKMIRGIDFYNHCFAEISRHPNVDILYAGVTAIGTGEGNAFVRLKDETIYASHLFNSIVFDQPVRGNGKFYLLQHFTGWVIDVAGPVFDHTTATLMDFRTGQQHGTAFYYVLPFSPASALVEYTLFSESLLAAEDYEVALHDYITGRLGIPAYAIRHREKGIIPMTNIPFGVNSKRITHIGTAGECVKPSSGYAFRFIQKQCAAIVTSLLKDGSPSEALLAVSRFNYYDAVFLNVLSDHPHKGAGIFSKIFLKNNPSTVLRFLDNESTIAEDLAIIKSLASFSFTKAGIQELVK